jgi:hypothetical protein
MNYYPLANNFSKQQVKEPEIDTKLKTLCVNIDSRDRNRNNFPSSNRYMVYTNPSNTFEGAGLYTDIRNIYSIRLVEAILPIAAQNYPYITLVIPELQDTMVGTNDKLKKAFSILVPERVNGNFISCKLRDVCNCFKKFDPPLSRLNRMTLEFYAPDGSLVNFGTDNAPESDVEDNVQNFLILEFTLVEVNASRINSRPVF